ncbi:MAG: helix-turn-helix domain-containing protein [bacterium]
MNYIIIFLKQNNKKQEELLIDFLKGFLGNINVIRNNKNLIINYATEVSDLSEIANVIINDFYIDITLLELKTNSNEYLDQMINLYDNLEMKSIYYLNEKSIMNLSSKCNNEVIKKEILKEYYNDVEMLKIIKVYLESDLNTTAAANLLYIHRNTLINKIDKFINITNYDIRKFKDASIIYQLIK